MKSRLGLSKENAIFQATELMDKYGKALSQKLNKNILYSYYEQYDIRTSGYVPNVKEGMDMIRIGKSDLEEHRVFFKNVVDDTDYARMILNIYHEGQHAIQFNQFFQSDDVLAKNQAIEEIAKYDNPEYYLCGENYKINLNEIQAEHSAFKRLNSHLSSAVSNEERNEILLNLVNQKIVESNDGYFIGDKGGTFVMDERDVIEQIDDAFADAYAASFDAWKRYDLDGPIPDMLLEMGIDKPDEFKEYVKTDKKARSVYEHARTREEQDLVVAAINCKLHPEYKYYFKCLENVDLSYEHVIEERYIELVNEGKVEQDKIYDRTYQETKQRLFGDNEPVKVPEKKAPDKKDLQGLSRGAMADELFGHLMQEENHENEPEK